MLLSTTVGTRAATIKIWDMKTDKHPKNPAILNPKALEEIPNRTARSNLSAKRQEALQNCWPSQSTPDTAQGFKLLHVCRHLRWYTCEKHARDPKCSKERWLFLIRSSFQQNQNDSFMA